MNALYNTNTLEIYFGLDQHFTVKAEPSENVRVFHEDIFYENRLFNYRPKGRVYECQPSELKFIPFK